MAYGYASLGRLLGAPGAVSGGSSLSAMPSPSLPAFFGLYRHLALCRHGGAGSARQRVIEFAPIAVCHARLTDCRPYYSHYYRNV
jgi:hypothetical protein